MTSIILSSDDPALEQQLGERLAKALDYQHVGRALLAEIAAERGVQEEKLSRALEPAVRRPATRGGNLLRSAVQSRTTAALLADSVVCTGLAAHLYVKDVSHILMMRVLAGPEAPQGLPPREQKRAQRKRARRARWSLETFGVNGEDPANYDMVISLNNIDKRKLVELIGDMVGYRKFQPMTYSKRCLQDQATAAAVRTALLPTFPEINVRADGDAAIVHVRCSKRQKQCTAEAVKSVAGQVPGVRRVEVHAVQRSRDLEKK
jgi:cytidylate kinase